LLSGTLAAKIEKRDLTETARLATAFAVVAVTHIGAGLPETAQLSDIAARITINHFHPSH
jgi:fructose-1-phosphate kinase PfkB-like protein